MVREAGGSQEGMAPQILRRRNYLKENCLCVIKCYINNITDYYYINSCKEKSVMSTEDKGL